MSVSLKSFVVEGKLAQSDVSLNGSGNTAYGVTGKLNADVQGFKAQLKVTDKTIQSVRAARAHRRSGARGRRESGCSNRWLTLPALAPRAQLINNVSLQPEDAALEIKKDGAGRVRGGDAGRARGTSAEACEPWSIWAPC